MGCLKGIKYIENKEAIMKIKRLEDLSKKVISSYVGGKINFPGVDREEQIIRITKDRPSAIGIVHFRIDTRVPRQYSVGSLEEGILFEDGVFLVLDNRKRVRLLLVPAKCLL